MEEAKNSGSAETMPVALFHRAIVPLVLLLLRHVSSFAQIHSNDFQLRVQPLQSSRGDRLQNAPILVPGEKIRALLQTNSELLPIDFVGMADIPVVEKNETTLCGVLRSQKRQADTDSFLVVPGCSSLPRYLATNRQQERWQLLIWNSEVVNRDGGIFDNLPYTQWTAYHERDAAQNTVARQYHMGKRTLYNYMMGRDWYKTARKELLRQKKQPAEQQAVLWQRMRELQVRELEMELAACEAGLAVARQRQDESIIHELEAKRASDQNNLNQARQALQQLSKQSPGATKWLSDLLDSSIRSEEEKGELEALPVEAFDNPYRLLQCLVGKLLKATIVGLVLEDSSWYEGTTLGGACVLQRQTATDEVSILGETVSVTNPNERFGNDNVAPGELYVVDCHADEILALHAACQIPLWVEADVHRRTAVPLRSKPKATSVDPVALYQPLDDDLVLAFEGVPLPADLSPEITVADSRIPRSAISRWDNVLASFSAKNPQTSQAAFPTDNPIQTLEEYDSLSDVGKVQTLTQLSNFDSSRIPRPRAVRENPALLDGLLLPRIDESVRTQFRIRETGDDTIPKSRRLLAREQAQKALEQGDVELALFWEETASLDLRADVTQDEGSYSRFLDRDDWYERDRKRASKRVDRAKFGNLLDGIE